MAAFCTFQDLIWTIEGIMNNDLRIIFSWDSQWLDNFNSNKTEAILFILRNVDNLPSLIFILI